MAVPGSPSTPPRDAAYRAIAAALPDTIVTIFDAGLRVRMLEGGGLDGALLTGAAYEGRPVAETLDAGTRDEVLARYQAALSGERCAFGYTSPRTGRQYHVSVGPLEDDHDAGPLGLAVWRDVTEGNVVHRRLRHLADHDLLTGLHNRRRFEEELDAHLGFCRRHGARGAVLLIDIDHFRYVNDTLGHGAGDELIAQVADALRRHLGEGVPLARLGGDEFAVLLADAFPAEAEALAWRLVAELRGHARRGDRGRLRPVTASIGVAPASTPGLTADELLTRADLAMYDAKEAGRDRASVYRDEAAELLDDGPGGVTGIRTRARWLDRVHAALEEDRFVLHGQPIVHLATGAVASHELLLRMVGDDGALIPPGAFLPVAERFGLIHAIDRWVIGRAINLAATRSACFSLNLSAHSLADPDLLRFIAARLAGSGMDPSLMTFEVTETAAVTNIEAARTFAAGLHDLGCRLSLDDFGAGFGTFASLKHLPFDEVKIDGEFVSGCTRSTFDQTVIDTVVRMATSLGKTTVAEFTQDQETVDLLRAAGVTYGQGFHLGRPGPLDEAASRTAVHPACISAAATRPPRT